MVLSLVLSLELYVFSLPTITSTHQAHVSRPGALHDADDPMEEDHLSRCPAPKFRKGGEKKVRGWKGNSTQAAEAVRRSWRLSQACLAWSMFGDDAAGGARERSRSRERNRSRAGGKKVEDVEEQVSHRRILVSFTPSLRAVPGQWDSVYSTRIENLTCAAA